MTGFFVPGIPRPKGSKSLVSGRLVESADMRRKRRSGGALKSWMRAIAGAARAHVRQPLVGAVSAELEFSISRPRTVKRDLPAVKAGGDVDKLTRAVLDALEGIAYDNDAQVIDLIARKRYEKAAGPGVWIHLSQIEGS